jgi:choline dehydrogenase-like flavoprotein
VFVDGRTLPGGAVLEADLCIIGAGPAGISVAHELAGRGLRILMFESGGIAPEIRRKDLDLGSSVGYQYYDLSFSRARAFGGTSSRWHMHVVGDEGWMARPYEPIDFEARPGIPWTGWPFGPDHLAPYYHRAGPIADLGTEAFDADAFERPGMRRLPLPADRVETAVLKRGMTAFTRHRDRFATLPDVTVVHHATVLDLVSEGEPAEVRRLEVAITRGRRVTATARRFILAAGGLENPRLLLWSRGHHPAGLGNGRDLVGRFFMEHLAGRVGYVEPAFPTLVRDAGLYDSHPEGRLYIQAALTIHPHVLRREGLPGMAFFLLPRTRDFTSEAIRSAKALVTSVYRRPWVGHTGGHLRNVAAGRGAATRMIAARVLRRPVEPTLLAVRVQAEQTPNPESRVTLGTSRDRYGMARPVLDWRINDSDLEGIRRGELILDEELRRAGLGHIERMLGEIQPPLVFEGDYHHIGTTRMDDDPARGVVDRNGRVHGVRNLWVAGSSVFPTAGWINPTLTVSAMAIRLADHLRAEIERG